MPLLDAPSTDGTSITEFFNLCELQSLSSSVSIEHIAENSSDGSSIQNLLAPLIPYVQLFMQSRSELAQAYQWTKSIRMHWILANVQCHVVDHLQLLYRYKRDPSIFRVQDQKCAFDQDRAIFYVHRQWAEQVKHHRDIFDGFARVFIPTHDEESVRLLSNFLSLLHNEQRDDLESFANYQQFSLTLNDANEIPWQFSSTQGPVDSHQPNIGNEHRVVVDIPHKR